MGVGFNPAAPRRLFPGDETTAVLCLPVIEWGFRFQRPQQIARCFARDGHAVLFARHTFDTSVSTRAIEPGIEEIQLAGPPHLNPYRDDMTEVEAAPMADSLLAYLRSRELDRFIVLVELPFWTALALRLRTLTGSRVIYDCMDLHAGFATNTDRAISQEPRLVKDADLVVVSSAPLLRHVTAAARRSVIVRNGADVEHFGTVPDRSTLDATRLTVGYYGAIAEWFDSTLVAAVADARPHWQFVLVGNTWTADTKPLEARGNILLLGEQPYARLPQLIAEWDCCIVPFRQTPLTAATNPVKVYEMLAAGKPVVASSLPELLPLAARRLVAIAETSQDWIAAIEAQLVEKAAGIREFRRAFASMNSWTVRYGSLSSAIASLEAEAPSDVADESHLQEFGSSTGSAPAGARPNSGEDRLWSDARATRGTVVFAPSVGWDIHLVQRPHHLARCLASDGYTVIFDCSNAADAVEDVAREVEPRLHLFKGDPSRLASLPRLTLWTFSYNFDYRDSFPADATTIYDWIDDLTVFPYDSTVINALHARALKEASVVVATAGSLHAQALAVRPDALLVPNGVDIEQFGPVSSHNTPLADEGFAGVLSRGLPVAGYYGALARWFDYELVAVAARARPDWSFVLIGPDHDGSLADSRVAELPNVHCLGPRPYHLLPAILHRFDVAMIPFLLNRITLATSPLKLFEYVAAGRPVISSALPECASMPGVRIVEDGVALAGVLDEMRSLGREPAFRGQSAGLAAQHTWQGKARAIMAAAGRASLPECRPTLEESR